MNGNDDGMKFGALNWMVSAGSNRSNLIGQSWASEWTHVSGPHVSLSIIKFTYVLSAPLATCTLIY